MRIAISQLGGKVSEAFELCTDISLHVLDFENNTSTDESVQPFVGQDSSVEWLASRDVQVLLTGSIDPDHAMLLGQAGVQVFTGADDLDPADNVKRFLHLVREAMENRSHGGCGCGSGGCHEPAEAEHECCGGGCHEEGDDHECCGGEGHDDPNHVCKCR
jgi:predicted Fe-Mo cluster-binding NifX family protein